ncbi:hypothetical protein APR41_09085 [Salegentibacter salinarum]|uniref:Ig-like domain-containing protein n=1 Tax=Salegentibacter salinarum TaxID=447422 RepID=A0A2N0TP17_9FLAO|nr:gliding motility-associated C-terminal domain-containing protein [Salegentibacter salinarum]PKD16485.1 hypothetical protein APR41_09085 [Salegentibacter salinarum]SKB64814.1 gliding motility-associated C-terminal domain-containing protein [Salegentibacter salinarum]
MQNFTFGRKGTNWFLFAFVLLIGTLPSFGQADCPDPDNFSFSQTQTVCFTQTVSELNTDGYPVYQTDENENDTQIIPEDELLVDGEIYYVGGESGQCERIAITVTVESVERPLNDVTNNQANGFEITSCTPADFNAEDLAELFDETIGGYNIEVYDSEFGTSPMADGDNLLPGGSYYVAQVPGTNVPGCPSLRTAVGFNPNQIEAPTAATEQSFCEDATVADLEAAGTYDDTQAIRWYRSQNANSPLADNTELINGATYYVGQVVNERGSPLPPCETPSEDRAAVMVTLGEPIENTPISAEVCTSQILPNPTAADFEDFYRGLLGNVEGGSFTRDFEDLVDQYENNPIGTFTNTYTSSEECESTEVTVEITDTEDANAGGFDNFTLTCATEESFDLQTLENTDDNATGGGTFSGTGVENNQFDVSVGPGVYPITYTVNDESADCITPDTESTTTFEITINDNPQEVDDISTVICSDDLLGNPTANDVRTYLRNLISSRTDLPLDGTFTNNTPEDIFDQFQEDRFQRFVSSYTVDTNCGEVTVGITIDIFESEDAEAGEIDDFTIACDAQNIIVLDESLLDETATRNGSFSAAEGVLNDEGNFDPSIGPGTYTITYSVDDNANPCITPNTSDATEFTIEVEESNQVSTVSETFCVSEIQELLESEDDLETILEGILGQPVDTDGTFEPGLDELEADLLSFFFNPSLSFDTFEATYTTDCSATDIELTIIKDGDAEAGEIDDIDIACFATDVVALDNSLLDNTATPNGVFTAEEDVLNEDGNFDPSLATPGTPYTITYSVDENSSDCVNPGTSDFTTFTITISEELAEQPDDIFNTICSEDLLANPTVNDVRSYLRNLISRRTELPTNGIFTNNSPEEILGQFQQNRFQTFNSVYTVETSCGDVTVDITLDIIESGDANAGEIDDITLVCFDTGEIVLDDSLLDENANPGGTFTAEEGVLNEDGNFDPSIGAGTYTITYSVDDSADCVIEGTSDFTTFDIIVGEDLEELNPVSVVICEDQVLENPSEAQIRSYFTNLVNNNTSLETGGNFDPSPAEILTQFENQNGLGIFETEYTVDTGDCGIVSVMLTAEVTPLQQADAGEFGDIELCTTDDEIQLSAGQTGGIEGGFFTINGEVIEGGIFNPAVMEEGDYDVSYTINEDTACVEGEASTSFTISIFEGPNAGSDLTLSYCETEIEELIANPGEAQNFLITLLENQEEDVDLSGDFDANVEELFAYYNAGDFSEPFVTTYRVSNENCEDTSEISITINEIEEANAGDFENYTFCSTDNDVNLNNEITGTAGGTFTVDGEPIENGIFSPSTFEASIYTITYTVNENIDCVEGEDFTTFQIEVIQGIELGENRSVELCINEVIQNPTVSDVRNYFRNLLGENSEAEGIFNPSIEELRASFQENPINTLTTTFTVENGECSDSVDLSVNIVATEEAEAGEIDPLTICDTTEDIDLFSLISDEANENGYFEGYEDGIFSPSMMDAGSYEITYTVDSTTACVEGEDSTTFTIEILQGADAGEDMDVTVCSNDGQQDLFSLISADADMDGEFTLDGDVIADGIMDPSQFETGTYEVIYSVTAEGDECGGDDSATITITLGNAPDAPTTGEAIAFCAIDGETATRLEADGTNLTWYSDAELSMMVSEEDLLVDGDYYVTQSSDEGCESEAAVLTVNIVDSPAPTISSDYELCEFDNPTIADLSAEINESGEITWYESADSMTALSNNATLTDGTTYYATLISDNGCESSERLAVTVTLEDCALLFPEAITPNGDGRNDRFVIENIEREYPNFNITIFNRWGNAIYKGNASTPTWDGTSNQSGSLGDDVLPVGVYFYVVDFNDGSTEPRQGKVYLNR